jgi:O-antigen ligase/Tfp pilus assembly protein PilF
LCPLPGQKRIVTLTTKDRPQPLPLLPAILEIGWLLAAVLPPLWINLWGSQPFDPAKISLLRWLVWLLVAVWLADRLLRPRPWRRELPPRPFLLPLLALSAVAILSSLASANQGLALWGSHDRAYGLVTLLSYLLLALLVAARLETLEQVRRLLTFAVATAVPILLLGGLQAAGADPLRLVSDARSPVYTTLGRANFTGAYLALLLPLTLTLGLTSSRRPARAGLLLLALAQLLMIGLVQARAAWLAAATGLLFVLAGWAWPRLTRRARSRLAGAAALLLASGALLAARWLALAQAGSVAARRVIWQTTLALIGERPLLGHGLDSLAVEFTRLFPPQLVYYQGRQLVVDRAHNWLLDTAVTLGILGLLATLWLWAALFWLGWRALRRLHAAGERESWLLLLGCLAALAANLTSNLVTFDVAATAVTGWLLVAAVIRLSHPLDAGTATPVPAARAPWRLGLAGFLLLAAILAGWWGNGRFLVADMNHQRSLQLANQGGLAAAAASARQAVALWPQEPAYWQHLAHLQGARGELDDAAASWQQALARRPADPAIWANMGQFHLTLARQGVAGSLALAEHALAQAVALAPNTARLYVVWGEAALLDGQADAAIARFEHAAALDATDPLAWAWLAEAYAANGGMAQAEAARQEAARWRQQP